MEELETLRVVIDATTQPLRQALAQVRSELNNMSDSVRQTTRNMSDSFRQLASRINVIKLAVMGVITGAITKFASSCIELGSDLSEVQNVVDVTFTNMSGRINSFAENAITQFGLSETVAKKYAGTLGAMAKSFGFTGDALYEMSTTLTGLTGDVASFYNISTDEAFTKLKSVFTGETESLKELGVVMTQTALDNYALANGYDKTTSEMTEQEKVALRYKFVLGQLSDASGDFSNTADSWANQTRVLSLQFAQLKANIGQGLINIFAPVLKVINVVMAKLRTLASYFRVFTEVFFGNNAGGGDSSTISTETAKAAQSSGTLAQNMSDANKSAKETQKSLQGFDEVHTLDNDSGSSSGAGADTSGIGDIGSDLSFGEPDTSGIETATNKVRAKLEALKKFINNATKGFRDTLSSCFTGIGKIFSIVVDRINNSGLKSLKKAFEELGKSLSKLYKILKPVLDFIMKALMYIASILVGAVIVAIGEVINIVLNIMSVVILVISKIIDAITWVVDKVIWLFKNLDKVEKAIIKGLNAIQSAIKFLGTAIKYIVALIGATLLGIIKTLMLALKSLIQFVVNIASVIVSIMETIILAVVGAITKIIEAIIWIVDKIVWFFENWENIWNSIKDLVASVCIAIAAYYATLWNAIVDTFKDIGTWFSNKFSSAWDAVQKAWNGAGQFFTGIWNNIKGAFSNVTDWFKDTFSKAWQAVLDVFNAGGQIFIGIKEGIVGVFETVVNGLIDGINKVIKIPFEKINDALNSIRDISILGAKPFSGLWGENPISIPQIPKLAQGGIVNRATLAMVGEAGAEAVMPLKNNTQWIGNLAGQISSRMNNNSQSGPLNIELMLNSKKFAQATIKDFEAEANRKGGLKVKLI